MEFEDFFNPESSHGHGAMLVFVRLVFTITVPFCLLLLVVDSFKVAFAIATEV